VFGFFRNTSEAIVACLTLPVFSFGLNIADEWLPVPVGPAMALKIDYK